MRYANVILLGFSLFMLCGCQDIERFLLPHDFREDGSNRHVHGWYDSETKTWVSYRTYRYLKDKRRAESQAGMRNASTYETPYYNVPEYRSFQSSPPFDFTTKIRTFPVNPGYRAVPPPHVLGNNRAFNAWQQEQNIIELGRRSGGQYHQSPILGGGGYFIWPD